MFYKAFKESNGTYTIRASKVGGNHEYEVIKSGVRGCNVNRALSSLLGVKMRGPFTSVVIDCRG